jgi:hypothetical protein
MALSKARRRQLILSWLGIALAWAASFATVFVLLTEWLVLALPAATVGALGAGALLTKRIRAHHRRGTITVGDLRAARWKER